MTAAEGSWEDVAARLRAIAAQGTVLRYRVTKKKPLTLVAVEGEGRLELGDEDLEIADAVVDGAEVDDIVFVFEDRDGDYAVVGFAGDEDNPRGNPKLAAAGKGVIIHDDDPDVERPSTFFSYEWQGSVPPNNAEDVDTWINTA